MPPPSLWLKTWPSVCQATQPTTMPPSPPHMLSAHAWHHMHRFGLSGDCCYPETVLCPVASLSTPVLTACGTCAPEGIAQGEKPQLPPALALNLRTAWGQHEIRTVVYFCQVTVILPPCPSQCFLQAGEGSRQKTRFLPA